MPTSLWHVTSKSLRPTLWSACLARRQWWRCQGSRDATLMMQPILRPPQMHHRQYLMMQYLMFALTIDANSSSAPIFIDQRCSTHHHMVRFPTLYKRVEEPGENYHRWSKYPAATTNHHPLSDTIQKLKLSLWGWVMRSSHMRHCIAIAIYNGYLIRRIKKSVAIQKVMTNFEKLALFNSRCHISSEKGERSVGGQSSPDNSRVARFPKEFSQNLATDPTVGH